MALEPYGYGSNRAARTRSPRLRRDTFAADDATATLPFGEADLWRVLVTWSGRPAAYRQMADPGRVAGGELADAALRRAGELGVALDDLRAELASRLGIRSIDWPRPTCTVVVCTHRRPEHIERALRALARLDPPAEEIIVLDSAPGELDCRALAESVGARYARIDTPGQNRARAHGVRLATSELVAFTDDDVVVAPGWLSPLPELFANRSVGAVTGAAFGRRIDTAAQDLRESFAGFVPAMQSRTFDWTNLRPLASGTAGAGANMIFRREVLAELCDAFPPELDGGTPTRSGGDVYALYRLLTAGYRITYDPRLHAEHDHHPDDEALRRTIRGYGTGFAAFLTRALVCHGEIDALRAWWWLTSQLIQAIGWNAIYPVTGHTTLRLNYVLGGVAGAPAWFASRLRELLREPEREGAEVAIAPARRAPASVALAGPTPTAVGVVPARSAAEWNVGARASEATILVFLGADVVPRSDLAERHANGHCSDGGGDVIVIGDTEPRALDRRLATQLGVMWHHDHHHSARSAPKLTFADLSGENFSMSRSLFERLGGFDERLSAVAAAAEMGLRAQNLGARLVYDPLARAERQLELDTASVLAAGERAGRDHAHLAARYAVSPAVLAATVGPWRIAPPTRNPLRRLPAVPAVQPAGVALARLLELGHFRSAWLRVFSLMQSASYCRGYAAALGPRTRAGQVVEIDLAERRPIAVPDLSAPVLRIRAGTLDLGTMTPPHGQWGRGLVAELTTSMSPPFWSHGRRIPGVSPGSPVKTALGGELVLLGPGHPAQAAAAGDEFTAAGVSFERLDGHPGAHWSRIAERLEAIPAGLVALPLPGVRPRLEWLRAACVPFGGDRVAAVLGTGVLDDEPIAPTELLARPQFAGAFRPIGLPPQYLVVSAAEVASVGGVDASAARYGDLGPVLDLVDRLLDAGFVVSYQETRGLEPAGSRSPVRRRLEWRRSRARGALLCRAAREEGGLRGGGMLAWHLVGKLLLRLWSAISAGHPRLRAIVGPFAAEVAGVFCALGEPSERSSTSSATL